MPPEIDSEIRDRILAALRAGRKDEAVALMRQATGIGEKQARAAVFLISLAGVSNIPDGPAAGASDTEREPATRATEAPADVGAGRAAVESSSGCGAVILLAVGSPLLWLLLSS